MHLIREYYMSGMWSQAGVPHKGWLCVGVEDFGSPDEHCEMCPNQAIRYGHFMRHPQYFRDVIVGCVCAQNMEEDYSAAQRRESALRNVASRRRNWLNRIWRLSRNGNALVRTDGMTITIFQNQQQRWTATIREKITGRVIYTPRDYNTSDEAKMAGFDAMIMLKTEENWGN